MNENSKSGTKVRDDAELRVSPEETIKDVERLLGEAGITPRDELGEATHQVRRTHWGLGHHTALARQWMRQAAIVVAVIAAITYLCFRVLFTLNLENPFAVGFSITLFCAEAYGLFHLSLYFYQVWRLVELPIYDVKVDQTVDVFVTTYNEDVDLLRSTLRACVQMEYPHTTYVLDDGERDEVRKLAESLGVKYITRTDHKHAKAGNVNNALRQTDGQFVIILDADHVPHMHFIMRMLGYFNDPKVGFVQAPHTTYNLDNFLGHWKAGSRIYWEDVRMFFEAVQLGKNRHGLACFCGSAAMFRRKALEEIGLFATETITEDLHTGMRINAAGWKSLAVNEELVVGLAPEDPETFSGQRLRWGEGNLSVMAYDNPLTMKGLNIHGRINYLASILNWTYGPARLIMYLVPIVMLFTAVPPVANLSATYIAIVALYLVSVWTAVKMASNKCGNLIGIELAMMASFHLHVRAVFRAIFRRRFQRFIVTSKRRQKSPSVLRLMWPQFSVVVLSLTAVSWASTRVALGLSIDYFGLAVGSLLAFYHSGLALTILRQASRQRDPDAQWRHPIQLVVAYKYKNIQGQAVTFNFNENGLSMLSRERLPEKTSIEINIESPFTNATSLGEITSTRELSDGECSMYVHEFAFNNPDPAARQSEIDSLINLSFGYAVPWSVAEYRGQHTWTDKKSQNHKVDRRAPLLLEVHAPDTAMIDQSSVVEQLDHQGAVATLAYPLNEGAVTKIKVHGPKHDITTSACVTSVHAVQVGVNIVYRHRFDWVGKPSTDLSRALQWMNRQYRHDDVFGMPEKKKRLPKHQNVAWAIALTVMILLTSGLFWATHQNDLLLIAATKRPLDANELTRLETIVETGSKKRYISVNRLLRMYKAAIITENPRQAAELAARLAEKDPEQRCRWMATSASHWVQDGQYQKANKLLIHVIASGCDRSLTDDERAALYIEAARVALAVGDINRSVSLFSKSGDLKSFTNEQIDEYIGLLVAAGKLPKAFQLLKSMGTSDRVLRHIVAIYETAKLPQFAVPVLETLYARHPDSVSLGQRLAELAFDRGDYQASIKYYREIQQLQPDDPNLRLKLAEVLTAAGQIEEAIELLREQKDTKSRMFLVSILETSGRFDEALVQLYKITGPMVNTLDYQKQLIRLLFATKRYPEAVPLLVKYLKLYPEEQDLGRKFIAAVAASPPKSIEPDPAINRTLDVIYKQYKDSKFQTFDTADLMQLAYALRRMDMAPDAVDVLKFAVKKQPDSRVIRLRLAQTLADLGRYQDAEVQFVWLLKEKK